MDNLKFGAFIAQLRRERGFTQKELADKLNVTDKAVSKWETGKGFPDVKLLEPLSDVLEISLIELIKCDRQEEDSLSVDEADAIVSQALDRSERTTARRYLSLFRWTLTGLSLTSAMPLLPYLKRITFELYKKFVLQPQYGAIGGADGPTHIILGTATVNEPSPWVRFGIPALLMVVFILLAFRVHKLEKELNK